MKRISALIVGLILLATVPGVAHAYPQPPLASQQLINTVINRALSQRGVPFVYGGGDISGPSLPKVAAPTVTQPEQSAPGLTLPSQAPAQAVPAIPGLSSPTVQPSTPTPTVAGFDASGLIVYAFAGAGIKMPRSSGEQYKVGRKIPPSLALPGDLIFYGPDGTQSVALFVGNGQMVEGTNPSVTLSAVRTDGMTPYLSRIIE